VGRSPTPLTIFTLDPNKFAEKNQQPLDLGYRRYVRPYISLHKQSSAVQVLRLVYDTVSAAYGINYRILRTPEILPYPPDTKAFLYYYMSHEKPRIAGELRLRVTSSDDAASFESGSDLLRLNGRPWSRPLCSLPKLYSPLYEKLREEGFVPDDLDRALSTLPSALLCGLSQILFTLNDTFIVHFSIGLYLNAVTEKGMARKMHFPYIFMDRRDTCKAVPYTGDIQTCIISNLILIILMNL
jgi:hypothetical protein